MTDSYKLTPILKRVVESYDSSSPTIHRKIWEDFYHQTNELVFLKKHRDYVDKYDYGYGDRPFHYMWKILVDQMPRNFKFLEIGVYKGQILSLIELLSEKTQRNARIYGITPLDNQGDQYSSHPDIDYLKAIKRIFKDFELSFDNTKIIKGLSQNRKIIKTTARYKPFDLMLIDGCHEYKVVVSDINNYTCMLKIGGLLVIDDASMFLKLPKHVYTEKNKFLNFLGIGRVKIFKGFVDVSLAIKNTLDNDKRFVHLFACGHDRVWMRIA